jgi:ferredoxin
MVAVVDPEACTGCETCVDACPAAAIAMEDGRAKVDPELCVE